MPREIEDTLLEPVGDLRNGGQRERTPTMPEPVGCKAKEQERGYQRFRPTHRPPMALMCVVDDGGEGGEWVRVRGDRIVVGQSEGDLLIPHDIAMSGKHFELVRELEDAEFCWYVRDLDSTNGTFVSINKFRLKHDQELLVGSRRYRFNAAPRGAAAGSTAENPPERRVTGKWQAMPPVDADKLLPSLIECTPEGEGKRYPLSGEDHYVGADSQQCSLVIEGDPFVEPRHAHIFRDEKRLWRLENTSSQNGTWVRINKVPVYTSGSFQAGEQRFIVKVL